MLSESLLKLPVVSLQGIFSLLIWEGNKVFWYNSNNIILLIYIYAVSQDETLKSDDVMTYVESPGIYEKVH